MFDDLRSSIFDLQSSYITYDYISPTIAASSALRQVVVKRFAALDLK
jgi:hypothetical protein